MRGIFITLIISLGIMGCTTKNENKEYNESYSHHQIDSLQKELSRYKEKYGELPNVNKDDDPAKNSVNWNISYYIDDFGEKTQLGYVTTEIEGTFSNSATTNSLLKVKFAIDSSSIIINLYEYGGNHPIKGEGTLEFKARDSKGNEYNFKTYNDSNGNNIISRDSDSKLIRDLLLNGGEIRFSGITNKYSSTSRYTFLLNENGRLKIALNELYSKK